MNYEARLNLIYHTMHTLSASLYGVWTMHTVRRVFEVRRHSGDGMLAHGPDRKAKPQFRGIQ